MMIDDCHYGCDEWGNNGFVDDVIVMNTEFIYGDYADHCYDDCDGDRHGTESASK